MKHSLLVKLAIFSLASAPVLADAPEGETSPESLEVTEELESVDLETENLSLQASLDELTAQLEEAAAMASTTVQAEALLEAVTTLIDPENEVSSRIEAAVALRDGGDGRSTPFLRSAMWDRELAVRVAAIGAFAGFPGEELIAAGSVGLAKRDLTEVQAAIDLLVGYHTDESAQAMWAATGAGELSRGARSIIRSSLEEHYADWLDTHGGPQDVGSLAGTVVASLTNGVVGSIALSTVGSWGKSDAAEGIGGFGGFLVGAGATWLEAQDDPITLGQGLFHASTTAAGLMMTSDLRDMFHGDDGPSPTVYRIYTLAGALGGAAVGRQGRDKFIEPTDVGEVLFTTMMSRFAALNLAATMGINSIEAEAGVAIAGSLAGGALGRHVAGRWNVSEADPLLGALGFMEGMAVGQVVNDNLMDRVENGWFEGNFAFAGLAGGLVYSHFEKPTVNEAVGIGFATGMGHILGYGLNDLAGIDDYGTSGLVSTGAGVASMIAATQFETSTAESYGRWVPVAADMALATYNAGMVVGWLHAKDMFAPASTLDSGIMFSTIALSGLQAQFNTPWSGPSTGRSLLLLSANAWGSYYATMGMIAGGEPLMDSLGENAILVPLVVGDAAMGYAMWASGAGGLFTPRDTAVVQMGGVAGVTLGALTVLMLVDDVQAMAVGSMVGGVVGAYAGLKLTDRFLPVLDQVTASIDLPDLPGVWAPTLSPTIMEDGSLGGHIGITAFGW